MMTMTPQQLRSPVSPYGQQSKPQSFSAQGPSYPTTPQSEPATARQAPNRGLGLIECRNLQEMPPSPQPSECWSSSPLMEADYPASTQPPDIFTAAFDPFSGYSSNPNTGMMSDHSPEAPPLVYCQSPSNSNMPSHRSSVSLSYSPSDSFSPNGSEYVFTPKVKVEESGEWYHSPAMEHGMVPACLSPYPQTLSPAPPEEVYRPHYGDWSKPEGPGYPISLHDTDGQRLPGGPILPSVTRTKKKRQRTTPEEATHECQVCGKLFKRSYNWKSHMETHNPERKYPHPCTAMIGNTQCTKKFQRKTDLDRHHDSVHLKAKNHQCPLCGNRFARRDTLRRHTEDGCPKRFELGFREGSAASPPRWALTSNFTPRNRSFPIGIPHSSPVMPTTSFPLYGRDFVGSPVHVSSVYHHS